MPKTIHSALAAAVCAALAACACGVKPEPMAAPPAAVEPAPPAESEPAPGDTADEPAAPEAVVLTPDGAGGFTLSGPYAIAGTLGRTEAGPVRLAATLTFPTGGFAAGEVGIVMLKRFPEHLIFTIPVTPPASGAMVTQALVEVAVEAETPATDGATFEVRIALQETP